MRAFHHRILSLLVAGVAASLGAHAQAPATFVQNDVLGRLQWRGLGPANFGGRVIDFAVDPRRAATFYVAFATGGLWKTVNNGTTWECVFDRDAISIGDVAIAPSNGDVLYLGTGEANNQRSSYHGTGVWKSSDAGKSWTCVGLVDTEHVGRIAVHPTDPNIAFVAAAGALYTPNDGRGLYRTRDGGMSWERVKHIDANVGFIDVAIDPQRPANVWASSYERRRRAHHFDASGPGSALWRSADGGDTWQRVAGLPTGEIGRIGIDLFAANPRVIVATIENRNPKPQAQAPKIEGTPVDADADRKAPDLADDQRRSIIGGEVWRSDDAGESWRKINGTKEIGGAPAYYYGQIRIDPRDDQTIYVLSVPVHVTHDGGKTWASDFGRDLHVDHHALWIDSADSRHLLLGNDGGFAISYDRGQNWDYHDELPVGQFYAVAVDRRDPYRIYGGTQDNGTWCFPSQATTSAGLTHADALKINGGDGFYVCIDADDQDLVYSETQFGGLSRQNLRTGERRNIKPRSERGQPALRQNWMSPMLISPHDGRTLYFGSQYLHVSHDRGDSWRTFSPDLTTADPEKIAGNVPHCTITTISESPRRAGHLYVGTDDGLVHVSRDGGAHWQDVSDRFAGLPKRLWVSRVEASPHDADRAYVAFTGYREDLREPFLYVTTDGGTTFRRIDRGLPQAAINVVREHPRNGDVVLVGHDSGVHVSLDGGGSWHALGGGLPSVPVHDLVVHPREADVVIGTHGRGLYVLDATPLERLRAADLEQGFLAFAPRDGRALGRSFSNGFVGARRWAADGGEDGAVFRYYLAADTETPVKLRVLDATGKVRFERDGSREAGLHTVVWKAFQRARRGGRSDVVDPGQYAVEIVHGEQRSVQPFRLRATAEWAPAGASEDVDWR